MPETTARNWREAPQRYRREAGKCVKCDAKYFPPRRVCAECGSREFETFVLADQGVVDTYTVIRVAPDEFSDMSPYAIALINLADGVKVMCQLVDCEPEAIEIGMPVKIEFRRIRAEGEDGVIFYGYKAVPA